MIGRATNPISAALRFRNGFLPARSRRSFTAPLQRSLASSGRLQRCAVLFFAAWAVSCGLVDDGRDEKDKYAYITFSDAAFEGYCLGAFDRNDDGRISRYEARRVLRIDCPELGIVSLYDLREFPRLEHLDCSGNSITELDVSKLPELEWLNCSRNRLASLVVGDLRGLRTLYCSFNRLTSLNLGATASLSLFEGRANAYPLLDLRGCSAALRADVTDNPSLKEVYCLSTQQIAADGHTQIIGG